MQPIITLTSKEQEIQNLVLVLQNETKLPPGLFSADEKKYIRAQKEEHKKEVVSFNRLDYWIYVCFIKREKDSAKRLENCRLNGDKVAASLNENRASHAVVFDVEEQGAEVLALLEGMTLGSYQFLKYKTKKEKVNTLEMLEVYSTGITEKEISQLNILTDAVYRCRTLINEPNSWLTAKVFAQEAEKMAMVSGASTEVLNRSKIEALKMGGLIGVNKGSQEPPTFTIMEWKPANAVNKKPVIFVGKGVVYDTGGMNLKPGDSMNNMKDDMSGAAAVASAIYAIALARLPVYIIGLMPATDNRPGMKALVSGDIITMHNGMTVEVLNTDAEGRLILADALSYAQKYDPALVIDLATLTGAAVRAIGKFGAIAMQVKAGGELDTLKACGFTVHERLVEFPMWDDYGEQIKSELADLKNLGPPEAGMITAGKFLEKFTTYPYIHLDIAGPAFVEKRDSYRGNGGTGFGVRLLFEFTKTLSLQKA